MPVRAQGVQQRAIIQRPLLAALQGLLFGLSALVRRVSARPRNVRLRLSVLDLPLAVTSCSVARDSQHDPACRANRLTAFKQKARPLNGRASQRELKKLLIIKPQHPTVQARSHIQVNKSRHRRWRMEMRLLRPMCSVHRARTALSAIPLMMTPTPSGHILDSFI